MSNGSPATGLNTGRDTALQWNWVSRGLMLKLVAIGLSSLVLSIIGALALVHWHWCIGIGAFALVHWHWCICIGALALVHLHWCIGIGALALAEPQALLTSSVGYTLGAGFFAALTFDFTGRLLCSVAPVTSPTRATIAGSIGCQLAAIIVFVTMLTVRELELPVRILIGILPAGCAHALAAVFFVMFARNVAAYLGRDDLALSPILVLFLFGGTSAMYMTIVVILVVLLFLTPCMWVVALVVQAGWQEYGLPQALLWPLTRPVPILFLGLLYFGPLYCYGRLLLQLRRAVNQRVRELT